MKKIGSVYHPRLHGSVSLIFNKNSNRLRRCFHATVNIAIYSDIYRDQGQNSVCEFFERQKKNLISYGRHRSVFPQGFRFYRLSRTWHIALIRSNTYYYYIFESRYMERILSAVFDVIRPSDLSAIIFHFDGLLPSRDRHRRASPSGG